MKKILILTCIILIINTANSQTLNYGVLLGRNSYDIEIDGPIYASSGHSGINIGGFAEYKLNKHFGARGVLLYSKTTESDYYVFVSGVGHRKLFEEPKLKTLQIHTLLKFDVRNEYNKGFYLISGFRMTKILDAINEGNDIKEFYKDSNFGFMCGFGVNFAKHFGLEIIPETNITNTLDSDKNKARYNFGVYGNLTVNLATLFSKKKE
jgi:hypothetical protein